jgi:hypothetical protein
VTSRSRMLVRCQTQALCTLHDEEDNCMKAAAAILDLVVDWLQIPCLPRTSEWFAIINVRFLRLKGPVVDLISLVASGMRG